MKFIFYFACLWETINSFYNFNVNPSVPLYFLEVVLIDDFLGEVFKLHVKVFIPGESCEGIHTW